jgi:hypothetical protein
VFSVFLRETQSIRNDDVLAAGAVIAHNAERAPAFIVRVYTLPHEARPLPNRDQLARLR